jgi:hypothetical protein
MYSISASPTLIICSQIFQLIILQGVLYAIGGCKCALFLLIFIPILTLSPALPALHILHVRMVHRTQGYGERYSLRRYIYLSLLSHVNLRLTTMPYRNLRRWPPHTARPPAPHRQIRAGNNAPHPRHRHGGTSFPHPAIYPRSPTPHTRPDPGPNPPRRAGTAELDTAAWVLGADCGEYAAGRGVFRADYLFAQ